VERVDKELKSRYPEGTPVSDKPEA
jgi:hypothetical protein